MLVQIHIFQTAWGDARAEFYDFLYTPTAWFDGVLQREGSYADPAVQYNDYRDNYFLPRLGIDTDVTITLTAEDIGDSIYEVTAYVCQEPGGPDRSVRLHLIQVLDHWPPSPSYSRNCFKQAADIQDLWLTAGECEKVERFFVFDYDSTKQAEDIKIIGWTQEPVSDATKPSDVHQAISMSWPFIAPIDLNSDEQIDLDDHALFADCLAGPGEVTAPPGCSSELFLRSDLDDDGDVDLDDYARLMAGFPAEP